MQPLMLPLLPPPRLRLSSRRLSNRHRSSWISKSSRRVPSVFGAVVSSTLTAQDEAERLRQRAERFGGAAPVDPEVEAERLRLRARNDSVPPADARHDDHPLPLLQLMRLLAKKRGPHHH
jgi:hypothetical protein